MRSSVAIYLSDDWLAPLEDSAADAESELNHERPSCANQVKFARTRNGRYRFDQLQPSQRAESVLSSRRPMHADL